MASPPSIHLPYRNIAKKQRMTLFGLLLALHLLPVSCQGRTSSKAAKERIPADIVGSAPVLAGTTGLVQSCSVLITVLQTFTPATNDGTDYDNRIFRYKTPNNEVMISGAMGAISSDEQQLQDPHQQIYEVNHVYYKGLLLTDPHIFWTPTKDSPRAAGIWVNIKVQQTNSSWTMKLMRMLILFDTSLEQYTGASFVIYQPETKKATMFLPPVGEGKVFFPPLIDGNYSGITWNTIIMRQSGWVTDASWKTSLRFIYFGEIDGTMLATAKHCGDGTCTLVVSVRHQFLLPLMGQNSNLVLYVKSCGLPGRNILLQSKQKIDELFDIIPTVDREATGDLADITFDVRIEFISGVETGRNHVCSSEASGTIDASKSGYFDTKETVTKFTVYQFF
eukprot:GHVS01049810.1.p1 GENE.GHVS01049810.1~~GHVS01049810.1.p1  ORF type:complete len:392 (-),score=39.48 GHVS01049810.1:211-1386(-)